MPRQAYTGETAVELAEVSVENLEGSKTALDVPVELHLFYVFGCGRSDDSLPISTGTSCENHFFNGLCFSLGNGQNTHVRRKVLWVLFVFGHKDLISIRNSTRTR